MIITFVHIFKKVTAIYQDFVAVSSFNSSKKIQEILFDFAQRFPDAHLLWVHESLANQVNYNWLLATSKNQVMYFFNPSSNRHVVVGHDSAAKNLSLPIGACVSEQSFLLIGSDGIN